MKGGAKLKNYMDFINSLDANFYAGFEKAIYENPFYQDAPNGVTKRHIEIAIISASILGKYHEWINQ